MSDLREKVIKLAYQKPELRKDLLPILKTAEYAGMDPLDYSAALAKLIQRLKKDTGATKVRMNYRGTGSQKMRRQLWVNWPDNASLDIWINFDDLELGGVVANRPTSAGGSFGQMAWPTPRTIPYNDRPPEQVYRDLIPILKRWLGQV